MIRKSKLLTVCRVSLTFERCLLISNRTLCDGNLSAPQPQRRLSPSDVHCSSDPRTVNQWIIPHPCGSPVTSTFSVSRRKTVGWIRKAHLITVFPICLYKSHIARMGRSDIFRYPGIGSPIKLQTLLSSYTWPTPFLRLALCRFSNRNASLLLTECSLEELRHVIRDWTWNLKIHVSRIGYYVKL